MALDRVSYERKTDDQASLFALRASRRVVRDSRQSVRAVCVFVCDSSSRLLRIGMVQSPSVAKVPLGGGGREMGKEGWQNGE